MWEVLPEDINPSRISLRKKLISNHVNKYVNKGVLVALTSSEVVIQCRQQDQALNC